MQERMRNWSGRNRGSDTKEGRDTGLISIRETKTVRGKVESHTTLKRNSTLKME